MELHIAHGRYGEPETIIPESIVRFMMGDRAMFEVSICKDGKSIEVRAGETCMVNGVLHASSLVVRPKVSNVVEISTPPYDEA